MIAKPLDWRLRIPKPRNLCDAECVCFTRLIWIACYSYADSMSWRLRAITATVNIAALHYHRRNQDPLVRSRLFFMKQVESSSGNNKAYCNEHAVVAGHRWPSDWNKGSCVQKCVKLLTSNLVTRRY